MAAMNKNITIIGKTDINIKNAQLKVSLPCKYFELSNFNFEYDNQYDVAGKGKPFELEHMNFFGGDNSAVLNNVTLTYTHDYTSDDSYAHPVLINKQTGCSFIIKNSEFNINIVSNNISTSYGIDVVADNTKLINNTINVHELYPKNENSYMAGVYVASTANNLIFTGNTLNVNGESTLYGIKSESNTNTIKDNTIIVTSSESTTTGVELTGNDNKVTDNKILANDKTGNDAVTATGENNVVENNTAAEFDTRIPTNIELNYDGTPIDVGQRLLIRGVFTANSQDASAEGIKIYDNEEELTSINIEDGTITYAYTPTVTGIHNITFKFEGNQTHKETETTISITANEHIKEYIIKVDTTEFTPGTNSKISASIYADDEKATDINNGKVTFKVNGKTLKDATTGKVIYAKVINGTATIENYQIPENWKNGTTIQATYTGSKDVAKMSSNKTEITITTTQPTFTTKDITTTQGSTITLKANITDGNKVINTGKVVFKINGKTIKDTNGKVIYAKVTNNMANVTYTLPDTYKAKNYTITATLISPDYERLEDTKTLTIN
jgi:hypothetical protein